MHHRRDRFAGVRNLAFATQSWLPETAAKAAIVIVHGLAEHAGRYASVAAGLVARGYAVHACDHVGHGASEGTRVFVERFDDFHDTLRRVRARVADEHPGLPVCLLGHSMGGLIVADHLLAHQHEVALAVLSAPAVAVGSSVTPLTITLGRVLARIAPRVGVLALDTDGLSRDRAVVQAYRDDPLVHHGKTTARLGAEMLAAIARVRAGAASLTLPLLIVQGGADRLVDPDGARFLTHQVGSDDVTLRVYDGLFHEVFNEPEGGDVLDDVLAWLDERVAER